MWAAIEEEEDIDEIQRVLQTFIFSIFIQRVHHAILEVGKGDQLYRQLLDFSNCY